MTRFDVFAIVVLGFVIWFCESGGPSAFALALVLIIIAIVFAWSSNKR